MRGLSGVALAAIFLSAQLNAADASPFITQVSEHFEAWDLDHNGKLSANELDALAASEKTTGGTAAAVAALKRTLGSTKKAAPEMTLENIVKLSKEPPADGPNFPKMYAEGLGKVGRANRVVFASDVPQMAALHQGRLGDCFCLAPLGAMLNRDPKQVKEMFHVQPDGKCSVTLGKKTVTVEMPTDTELALSASAKKDGVWVNLYEKAVGAVRNDAKPEKDQSGLSIDAVAHGGSAGTVMSLITGHEIKRTNLRNLRDEKASPGEKSTRFKNLREQLVSAVRDKRLITCGTAVTTTPGITPNHAYAVLDYDEKADSVKLWNPHGTNFTPTGSPGLTTGYPRKDGIFSMSLAEYVQQFVGVAFEQAK